MLVEGIGEKAGGREGPDDGFKLGSKEGSMLGQAVLVVGSGEELGTLEGLDDGFKLGSKEGIEEGSMLGQCCWWAPERNLGPVRDWTMDQHLAPRKAWRKATCLDQR